MPNAPGERAEFFASCLGRLSATREHAWLMGGADHQTEAAYSIFEDLLEAVIDDARATGLTGPALLSRRINAKMAQAQLLQAATFVENERQSRNSARLAEHYLLACQSLVIG